MTTNYCPRCEALQAENEKMRAVVDCVGLDVPTMRREIGRDRSYTLFLSELDALGLANALEALEEAR